MSYSHTQRAPLHWLLSLFGFVFLLGAWTAPDLAARLALFGFGAVNFVLALAFQHLTTVGHEDHLLVRFGPLPIFKRRIFFADLASVKRGRTTWADGWGVRWSPGEGWTWNLWGFDCLVFHFKQGKMLRVGTDDVENLEAFVQQRLAAQGVQTEQQ